MLDANTITSMLPTHRPCATCGQDLAIEWVVITELFAGGHSSCSRCQSLHLHGIGDEQMCAAFAQHFDKLYSAPSKISLDKL